MREKPGFRKVKYLCDQAKEDGFEYAWIDTCCIDKSDPAELSLSLNSMFTWYRESAVCYAYLSHGGLRNKKKKKKRTARQIWNRELELLIVSTTLRGRDGSGESKTVLSSMQTTLWLRWD
jgi:hypothetical protein